MNSFEKRNASLALEASHVVSDSLQVHNGGTRGYEG